MNRANSFLILIIGATLIISLEGCSNVETQRTAKTAPDGTIDLRGWDFSRDGIINLTGQWRFYWNQHLPPDSDFDKLAADAHDLIHVPGAWNGNRQKGSAFPGAGFGSYHLRILLPPQTTPLAMKLLDVATAYRLYVNGTLLHSSGSAGQSIETSIPRLAQDVIPFAEDSGTLDILMHVSNFHHRDGGVWESVTLGSHKEIQSRRLSGLRYDFFLLGSIVIMGLFHLGLHWKRKEDKSSLYFGIFCLLLAVRLITTGQRYLLDLVPGISFEVLFKLIYISYYMCVPVFALYFRAIFQRDFSRKASSFALFTGSALSVMVLFTPTRIYSLTMPVFDYFTIAMLCYGTLVIGMVVKERRDGGLVFLCGFLPLLVATANDILYMHQVIYTGHYFKIGFFIFIFSQAYLISARFSKAFTTVTLQRSHLEEVNTDYLQELRKRKESEIRLRQSEEKFRLIAENATDIIWVLNISTLTFDYVSPSVERIGGFTCAELISQPLEEHISPESYRRAVTALEEELSKDNQPGVDKDRSLAVEVQLSLKDGRLLWMEAIASFIRDKQGAPAAVLMITRDIEARKRAESAIKESEKKYRYLFENGTDLLCIHDLDGNVLETNLEFKQEYGWESEDLKNMNVRNITTGRYRKEFDQYMEAVLAHGSAEGILIALTKSGQEVALEYRSKLIIDSQGLAIAVHSAARDVTRRIEAEKTLKKSEERCRQILQYVPAGICELDIHSMKFISVNDMMCDLTHYSRNELMALHFHALFSKAFTKILDKQIEAMLASSPQDSSVECSMIGKNQNEFTVLVKLGLISEKGVPRRILAVVQELAKGNQPA